MTIQEMEKALSEWTADNTSEVNISVLSMEEVLAKIKIEGDRTKLPRSRVYPISNYKLQKLKEYLDENLKKGFISPNHALYASPVLFAVKPNGSLRVCVDYQKLNAITKRNQYPIPLIEETLAKVTGCKYLTKLDVIAAFNKLRMHPNSEDYTTFITSMGAYKYHVLPFGLTNGLANYQHYMNNVL
ncbi:gag polymerase env [Lasallia pustulata]|uniref:Gag polymerase env n=1 Tax=Lasallia pustulata TaxID=136370 RepID=A0A1W5CZC1_9LECA|nr:gag polymerase env [Lasallia pustulata]